MKILGQHGRIIRSLFITPGCPTVIEYRSITVHAETKIALFEVVPLVKCASQFWFVGYA
jgi:hypothetical protein